MRRRRPTLSGVDDVVVNVDDWQNVELAERVSATKDCLWNMELQLEPVSPVRQPCGGAVSTGGTGKARWRSTLSHVSNDRLCDWDNMELQLGFTSATGWHGSTT